VRSGIPIAGADAVVVGRSNIVGIPVAALLNNADATVTICHSKTRNLPDVVRRSDIVVAAIGRPEYVRGDWIKPGAAVIDVGINRIEDPTKKSGFRLVGDVAFNEAVEVAGAITPVPGGVGPMTIAMLLTNTVRGFKIQHGLV
jgi:methylenetetrahydrofolate dehydrogenase (NADP+)/methenyltetrahydrofolate cyclohydrolase/formyltetrahydrofolate synthetase